MGIHTFSRYAPVGPIMWLEQLQTEGLLGDYLLLLAHDVLKEQQRYRQLMEAVRDEFSHPFIILDNSLIELGAALPPSMMKVACDVIRPSCVVLPDVLGDPIKTAAASVAGQKAYRGAGITCPSMAVVQGQNIPQLQWCAQQLAIYVKPQFWGLPRIVANTIGTRRAFDYILGLYYAHGATAHLLGMSSDTKDDLNAAKMSGVMGIDSANPLIMGQKGMLISRGGQEHLSREGIWGEKPLTDASLENVRRMREWTSI